MAISQQTRDDLYKRAGSQCECTMSVCSHHSAGRRCGSGLSPGYWDAHHKTVLGGDGLSNLTAMCATCHKNTSSYGRLRP